jgi:magnesium transporter
MHPAQASEPFVPSPRSAFRTRGTRSCYQQCPWPQGGEIYRRAIKLTKFAPPEGLERLKDVLDQYESVARISAAQMRFQQGVTKFYRACTDTKMTIAAERLAVIAAITLAITSLSSVLGMNVIVNDSTRLIPLIILCLIMLAISLVLLRWTRKLGWW